MPLTGERTGFQINVWWRVKNEEKLSFRTPKALCTLPFLCGICAATAYQKVCWKSQIWATFPIATEVISPLKLCICVLPTRAAPRPAPQCRTDRGESEHLQPSTTTGSGTTDKHQGLLTAKCSNNGISLSTDGKAWPCIKKIWRSDSQFQQ